MSRGSETKGAPSQRQLRVAEAMRHELAMLLTRGELRDPALLDANITVTRVSVSPDLRRATAFVTRLGRTDVGLLLPVLNRGAPRLRGAIARALKLRLAPEIAFAADVGVGHAAEIEAVLRLPEVARDLGPKPRDGKPQQDGKL